MGKYESCGDFDKPRPHGKKSEQYRPRHVGRSTYDTKKDYQEQYNTGLDGNAKPRKFANE